MYYRYYNNNCVLICLQRTYNNYNTILESATVAEFNNRIYGLNLNQMIAVVVVCAIIALCSLTILLSIALVCASLGLRKQQPSSPYTLGPLYDEVTPTSRARGIELKENVAYTMTHDNQNCE